MIDPTIAELRAVWPEAVAEIERRAVALERERVRAHVTLGESMGDLEFAVNAAQSGQGLEPWAQRYMDRANELAQARNRFRKKVRTA